MKYCLVGPMTGVPGDNASSFAEAASRLRQKGLDVVSPVEMVQAGLNRTEAHRRAIRATMEADALILLPGWGRSEGAKLEVLLACTFGKELYAYHQHRPDNLERLENVRIVTRAEMIANG